jgi:hypothetical protein
MGSFNSGREKFFENVVQDTGTLAEYAFYVEQELSSDSGDLNQLSMEYLNSVHSIDYGHYNDMWCAYDDIPEGD